VTAQVKQATQDAIKAAARRLFARDGIEGTSTRDLAVAAKIGAGTLFNYFSSKEALAITLVAEELEAGRQLEARNARAIPSLEEEKLLRRDS
jgi:AcrR family transcriptional regulator